MQIIPTDLGEVVAALDGVATSISNIDIPDRISISIDSGTMDSGRLGDGIHDGVHKLTLAIERIAACVEKGITITVRHE